MFLSLKLKFIIFILTIGCFFAFKIFPAFAANNSLSLTISPPVFQLTIGPGEFWASNLKIVNTNPYDLTVYASVMDFEATDEEGHGKFIPILESVPDDSGYSLASWIDVYKEPIFVPKEKSFEIPFSVRIPENAPPGGYYAAILVGTQPPPSDVKGSSIQVSSMVSSLLFVRIKGEVREEGRIREFFSEKNFYQTPEVDFLIRFENVGNVHLQPQGDISIYNMAGKRIDIIELKEENDYGNVLPQTTKKLNLKWEGEDSVFNIGRNKAVATLTYGENGRQNISATVYFWVLPLKLLSVILGGIILFIFLLILIIRLYTKRSILRLQNEISLTEPKPKIELKTKSKIKKSFK